MVRGRWLALEREEQIKSWAKSDKAKINGSYEVVVEQEPGSGGKKSAEATIRNLAGFRVFADKVTGSKEVRAEPFAAQVQGGNVFLVAGPSHASCRFAFKLGHHGVVDVKCGLHAEAHIIDIWLGRSAPL